MTNFDQYLNAVRTQLQLGWPAQRGLVRQRGLSNSTVEQYLTMARRVDRGVVSLLAPHATVHTALQAWRSALEREFRADKRGAASIHLQVAALRTVLAALQILGLRDTNPASTLSSISVKRGLPRPMEPAQVEQLCKSIDYRTAEGRRRRTLVELLFHGLRRAEAVGLTTACLDVRLPTHIVVHVRGKGDSERLVPLHPAGSALLSRYLLDEFGGDEWLAWFTDFADVPDAERLLRCAERLLRKGLADTACPVFRNATGAAVSVRWVNRQFARYRDAAQLSREFGPHALRHTFGTELLRSGEDIRTVQELLGHADIRSTTIYTKVALDTQAHATQKLPTPAAEEAWITSF